MVDHATEFVFQGDFTDRWGEYYDDGQEEEQLEDYESSSETPPSPGDQVHHRIVRKSIRIVPFESYHARIKREREREAALREQEKRDQLRKLIGMKSRKEDGVSIKTELSFEIVPEEVPEKRESDKSSDHSLVFSESDSEASSSESEDFDEDLEDTEARESLDESAFRDDGIQKFFALVKKLKLRPIRAMKEMLLSDTINLRYYGIDSRIVEVLSEVLLRNTSVLKLDFTDNWLSVEACSNLSKLLQSNELITELNLSGCKIGAEGAEKLAEGIANSYSLEKLNLSGCELGDDGLKHVTTAVSQSRTLRTLDLSKNRLAEYSGDYLKKMLTETSTLEELNLSWNHLWQGQFAETFFEGLSTNSSIRYLNMAGNGLGDRNTPHVAAYLEDSPNLVELNLSSNRFTKSDASQIASALTSNRVLEVLRLGNNPLEPSGAATLVNALLPQNSPNLQLRLLDLDNVWAEKEVLSAMKIIEQDRPWLTVELAGTVGNYKLHGPDTQRIFVRRAQFEAMNTKKKSQRRDFGNFVLGLKDEMVSSEVFKHTMKKFKLKLSASLIDELASVFEKEGQVDLTTLKKVYSREYPDAEPPPAPIEPEKKTRKSGKKSPKDSKEMKKSKNKMDKNSKNPEEAKKERKTPMTPKESKKPEKKTDKGVKPGETKKKLTGDSKKSKK